MDCRSVGDFAFSIRQIFRRCFVTSYASRNVLINSVLQFWEVQPTYEKCSNSKLQHELENISSILQNNGYPESIIQITMSKKIALFNCKPKERPQKCPVYLKLPWIGKISLNFEKQTKTAINQCYQAVVPRIIFTTRKILPAIHKDVLPSLQQSMVVYQYVCRCDCRYVGRTSQNCRTELINTFRDA